MTVPHEITFIAFQTNEDGTQSIYDIVETSFHFAAHFARRFRRNDEVSSFVVCRPGARQGKEIKNDRRR